MKLRLIVFFGLCLAAVSAFAYVPPAFFIIKNMASKRTGVRSVRITSIVSAYDSGKPTGQQFKAVTYYNPETKTMKSEALDATGKELFFVEKKADQIPLSFLVLYDPLYRDILFALKQAGIQVRPEETMVPQPMSSGSPETSPVPPENPEEAAHLSRWHNSVAWVFGLSQNHKDGSQLWIEKDSFLALRVVADDQDIQFTKYRYSRDLPYPRTSSLSTRAGAEVLQEDISEFTVNPPSSENMMSGANGFTDEGNASPFRDLIRKYYAGLR